MFANVNGYKIFFDVEGLQYVPDGPKMRKKPVCFVLHGGPGGDHSTYIPALAPLSDIMQLVYVDDRNCGYSEIIDPSTNSMKVNCEDLEAVREYLGLDKIFILGQSYGGMKAQRYIIDYPDHLYGAILACTSPSTEAINADRVAEHVKEFGTEEQYLLWTQKDVYAGKLDFRSYMEKMGSLYHAKGKFDADEYINGMSRAVLNNDVINSQMSAGDMVDFNYLPLLPSVKVPCLCLYGEKDFICDKDANEQIADAIPGSERFMVPNASHEIFVDYPEIVMPVIKEFVEKNYKD